MNKAQVLDQAKALLGGDRQDDYGDARENHERIARLWSEALGVKVEAWQVAVCMGMVKVSRAVQSPDKADTWVDMAAYAAIGGEVSQPKGLGQRVGFVAVDEVHDLDAYTLDAFTVARVPVIEPGMRADRLEDELRGKLYDRLGQINGTLIVVDRFGVHHERIGGDRGDVWQTARTKVADPMTPERVQYDKDHGPYTAVAQKVLA
ncbi:phosphofructokinase [Gordonia phage Gsput1]|uniref:DUF6378 domain-containing protein n=1 Tax=Gordonia phage Gsput1 TaxID=1622193 RepID=A0A0E3T8C0_9CAUD|nr:phosphofructokinase [Gordonia phage Gsput1]AKC03090.1 hypothetical protein Gsput1_65 [Gordonia phage Gsput1]